MSVWVKKELWRYKKNETLIKTTQSMVKKIGIKDVARSKIRA
jgi:hypothetical protein